MLVSSLGTRPSRFFEGLVPRLACIYVSSIRSQSMYPGNQTNSLGEGPGDEASCISSAVGCSQVELSNKRKFDSSCTHRSGVTCGISPSAPSVFLQPIQLYTVASVTAKAFMPRSLNVIP